MIVICVMILDGLGVFGTDLDEFGGSVMVECVLGYVKRVTGVTCMMP